MKGSLKNYACSYTVEVLNSQDPISQLFKLSKPNVKNSLNNLLAERKLKIPNNFAINFSSENNGTKYPPIYFNSNAQAVFNNVDINVSLETSYLILLKKAWKWFCESSGWLTEPADGNYINRSIYNPLAGSSYVQLPKELINSKKSLINIQNKDNECFRWCHIRHLNQTSKNVQSIWKRNDCKQRL